MERALENLYIWKESRMVVNGIYNMLAESNDWGFKTRLNLQNAVKRITADIVNLIGIISNETQQ